MNAHDVEMLLPWYQRTTFPDGTTVGTWPTEEKCELLLEGVHLQGKTALDIACMAGMSSKWMEERGADVIGCDIAIDGVGNCDNRPEQQFALVKREFGLAATYRNCSVYDIPDTFSESFDVVLMMGLYYHLQHPLLGIQRAWEVTEEVLVLEGEINQKEGCFADFYEGEYLGDASNWWVPTAECLVAWCRSLPQAGRIEIVYPILVPSRMGVRVWKAEG